MASKLFSICIPNYNYANYLPITCDSVVSQEVEDYEIVIADNHSTDGSIDYIKKLAGSNPKVKYVINPTNLGFAGNLEKVTSLASGEWFILLSSDDVMKPEALQAYTTLIDKVGKSKNCVIGSSVEKIDAEGKVISRPAPDISFWKPEDVEAQLTQQLGYRVYKVKAKEMLARCLKVMGNPYHFLTVCYPSTLFEKVGGYGGGRMYNPDKWFNWKLFSEAETVYLIDEPLFGYRWHTQNQVALESSRGHLKFMVDEYRNTIELSDKILKVAGISRKNAETYFVKRDIYRHGIGEFTKGRYLKSLRIYFFGLGTFPGAMIFIPYFLVYTLILLTTPIGSWLSSKFRA